MKKEKAIELIRESGVSEHAELLISLLLPSARVVLGEERKAGGNGGSVQSHFGGVPWLPKGFAWPRWDRREFLASEITRTEARIKAKAWGTKFGTERIASLQKDLSSAPLALQFIAQLRLSELHAATPLPGWPREGSLAFFYDPTLSSSGFDPLHRGHRVIHFSEAAELVPTPAPVDLPEEANAPELPCAFALDWTLPHSIRLENGRLSIWNCKPLRGLFERLRAATGQDDKSPVHRCAGHPEEVQGSMQLECQLVTNGLYCGDSQGYKNPRAEELAKGADEWRLLLQVDSDDRLNWMWGDAGRIYFWARQEAIEAKRFDEAWAILQGY
ncbi:MAG: YwqG family protein [Planctomycetota bacterium]|nr:YwqG family protein [Planctomycetota bacterium]